MATIIQVSVAAVMNRNTKTVAWNKEYSQRPDMKFEEPNNRCYDMKGYVVILNTEFAGKITSCLVMPTAEFQQALKVLAAPEDDPIGWFLEHAWAEEPRRPEDDPDCFRVSATAQKIWATLEKLTVHRLFWRIAFVNADLVIQGHYLGE